MASSPARPSVFISYSHQDESWKNRLVQQLRVLEQEGALEIWDDRRIVAGDDWRPKIETAMARARAAVLLISADFLTSGFIRGREVPELLLRRETAGLPVIPVIVRPCPWQAVPWLAKIPCWPKGGVTDLASLPAADAEKHLSSLAFEIHGLLKTPASRPAPVSPQMPPPIPQPLSAPRRSTGRFLLGIGCGAVLAFLVLGSLGSRLSKQNAESTAAPPAAADPAATETVPAAATLGGRFTEVWFEPNVEQDGRTGMRIHAGFTIEGAQQQSCQAAAYFYDSTGQILKDFNQSYRDPDGQVAVGQSFTPPGAQATYEDFTLFLPYDELHLAPGNFDLKFQMMLHHLPTESVIAESETVDFMMVVS